MRRTVVTTKNSGLGNLYAIKRMKKNDGKPNVTGPNVLEFSEGYLLQNLLKKYVEAANEADDALERQASLGKQITHLLFGGTPVGSDLHSAKPMHTKG